MDRDHRLARRAAARFAVVLIAVAATSAGCGKQTSGGSDDGGGGGDTTAPTVVAINPPSGSSFALPVNGTLTLTVSFSEPVSAADLGSTLSISPAAAVSSAQMSSDQSVAYVIAADFETSYSVTVSNFADKAGNPLAPYSWSFKTSMSTVASIDPPGDLAVSFRGSKAEATWTPVAGAQRYNFYVKRNGVDETVRQSSVIPAVLNIGDAAGGSYEFTISSVDNKNRESVRSAPVLVDVAAKQAAPTTTIRGRDVTVAWNTSAGAVAGTTFNLYCGYSNIYESVFTNPQGVQGLITATGLTSSPHTLTLTAQTNARFNCVVTAARPNSESVPSDMAANFAYGAGVYAAGTSLGHSLVAGHAQLHLTWQAIGVTVSGYRIFAAAGTTPAAANATPVATTDAAIQAADFEPPALFDAAGQLVPTCVSIAPSYDDGAGNTSLGELKCDRSWRPNAASFRVYTCPGSIRRGAGDARALHQSGNSLYWLSGSSVYSWDLVDNAGSFFADLSQGTTSLGTPAPADFAVGPLNEIFYSDDASANRTIMKYDVAAMGTQGRSLLANLLPIASAPTTVAASSAGDAIWFAGGINGATQRGSSIQCVPAIGAADPVLVAGGLSEVTSLQRVGVAFYFATASGVYRVGDGTTEPTCAPATPVQVVAGNRVSSLAVANGQVYFIEEELAGSLGYKRMRLMSHALADSDVNNASPIAGNLLGASYLMATADRLLFLNGMPMTGAVSGNLVAMDLTGAGARAVGGHSARYIIAQPLVDGDIFVGESRYMHRLPVGFEVPIAAPTESPTVTSTPTASMVALDVAVPANQAISQFSVTDKTTGSTFLGLGVPGTQFLVTGLAANTAYTFSVCLENVAGAGPCVEHSVSTTP